MRAAGLRAALSGEGSAILAGAGAAAAYRGARIPRYRGRKDGGKAMTEGVQVIGHPLVQHKLTLLRKKQTSTIEFRRLLGELAALMAYEVTRDLPLRDVAIET